MEMPSNNIYWFEVENLHDEFSKENLSDMHSDYLLFTTHYSNFTLDQFFIRTGFSCQDMFLECQFGGKIFDCCKYAIPTLTDIGLCYRFHNYSENPWENRQYIPGSFYGAQFIIYIHKDEYPDVFVTNFFETGVRFFIHPDSILPMLSAGGTAVSPGHRIYAGIVPTHYALLPESEWGQCKSDWEPDEDRISLDYSSSSCEALCVAKTFTRTCNCTPLRYHIKDKNLTVCEPYTLYSCLTKQETAGGSLEGQSRWYQQCRGCKIECDRWDFRQEVSYARIPSVSANNFMKSRFNLSGSQLKTNVIIANMFMQELWYSDFTQQQATGWTETLSDIGGNLGLFLGASVITLFEIIVYLGKLCWTSVSKNRRKFIRAKKAPPPTPEAPPLQLAPSISVIDHDAVSPDPCDVVLRPLPLYTLEPPDDPERRSRPPSPAPGNGTRVLSLVRSAGRRRRAHFYRRPPASCSASRDRRRSASSAEGIHKGLISK